MKIYYSDSSKPKSLSKSIFLAGPSPRERDVLDWRIQAVKILEDLNFDGEVFIPIPQAVFLGGSNSSAWNYLDQITWECDSRLLADKIVFWVPRDIQGKMPGFTTNVEFGEDLATGKVVYGRPDSADKCRYLDFRNQWIGNHTYNNLFDLLSDTVKNLGTGSLRENGEVHIPLEIWQAKEFKDWYANLKVAGNTLVDAKVLSVNKVGNNHLFSYNIHVNIWVESEQRHKSNEFVLFRKNISSVVAYYKENDKTSIVLVKEFRSCVNNQEGFVYELPSGSSFDDKPDLVNAQQELYEETSLNVEGINRFNFISKRQVAATLCTYTCSLYSIALTKEEFDTLSQVTTALGDECEKTYVTVLSLNEIYKLPLDFSVLGMIHEALKEKN